MGLSRWCRRRDSVTHKILLNFCATPARHRRACAFRVFSGAPTKSKPYRVYLVGAEGETRTRTPLRALAPLPR